jgi:hypothetical protein
MEEFYKQYSTAVHFLVLVIVTVSIAYVLPIQINRETQSGAVVNTINNESEVIDLGGVNAGSKPGIDYGPWFSMSRWGNCEHLMQQGSVFEIQNLEGKSMLSECTPQLPTKPFDWYSGPSRFRLVKAPLPRHSPPTPEHIGENRPQGL